MSKEFSSLFEGGRILPLADAEAAFRTDDRVQRIHLVLAGQVDLVRYTHDGARMILQRVLPGQIVAEASAYSQRYHCDGIARGATTLRGIPVAAFCDRLGREPRLFGLWAAHLAHAMQAARLQAEIRTLRTVSERLDAWLGHDRKLPPKGHWQDLAQILGVSREALYRELARRRAD